MACGSDRSVPGFWADFPKIFWSSSKFWVPPALSEGRVRGPVTQRRAGKNAFLQEKLIFSGWGLLFFCSLSTSRGINLIPQGRAKGVLLCTLFSYLEANTLAGCRLSPVGRLGKAVGIRPCLAAAFDSGSLFSWHQRFRPSPLSRVFLPQWILSSSRHFWVSLFSKATRPLFYLPAIPLAVECRWLPIFFQRRPHMTVYVCDYF